MLALRPVCLVTNTLYQYCCYFRDVQGAPAYLNDAVEAVRLLLATKQAKHEVASLQRRPWSHPWTARQLTPVCLIYKDCCSDVHKAITASRYVSLLNAVE